MTNCVFCRPEKGKIFFETQSLYCIWDAFPVSKGHALIIPKRHFGDWFEATSEEMTELLLATNNCRKEIFKNETPDGFNIGINIGVPAGQTIPHLHVHVIPRYSGDMMDPRGGVRHVIPSKGNYLLESSPVETKAFDIYGGPTSPLIDPLLNDFEEATAISIAVAFVTGAGINEIRDSIEELLGKNGKVQILTGDFNGFNDPKDLLMLLDWQKNYPSQCEIRFFETKINVISFKRA